MNDPPLTEQQRAALDARDRSVSLAAGAGCGKTFVLTERFIAEVDPTGAAEAADLD
jgi:ATP-dependent helicase/nuclease subunit A